MSLMGVELQTAKALKKLFIENAQEKKITAGCGFCEQEEGQPYVIG